MLNKIISFLLLCFATTLSAQKPFSFAHVTDVHIGNQTAEEDLRRTVRNINSDTSIHFVILSGDITEFGSDEEIMLAKAILDSLNKPWYIIPGNHDSNWSESGSNTFKKVFGAENFRFIHNDYLFLGTASGPNMRMSPGQIPREHIVWLDSTLKNVKDRNIPIVYINHYPQDSSLNNWYEAIDRVKNYNIQLMLCGHGHNNRKMNFEGIPAVMGRSNLRAKKEVGGFNVITVSNGLATFEERNPVTGEEKKWAEVPLVQHHFEKDTSRYYRPSFAVNDQYKIVKKAWTFQDNSDIGSGTAFNKDYVFASNTSGHIYALHIKSGKKAWSFTTGGKVYTTPSVYKNYVVAASTDNNIYCLNAGNGKMLWEYKASKPIVANPLIHNKTVYIGSSDGHFRALDLKTGKLKWSFDSVKNFVVTKPLFYKDKIYFGSWGTELYALDAATGKLAWRWSNSHSSRMFSPAACYPVGVNNRVFIVAPDRYMTALDAETGNVVWRKQDPKLRVRESMGLSADSTMVYAKTMDGQTIGVSTASDSMNVVWTAMTDLGYELAPTTIVEKENIVYVPSDKGVVTAVNRKDGAILWKHKISNALVTGITPLGKNKVIVTTMDGKVTCLQFIKGK